MRPSLWAQSTTLWDVSLEMSVFAALSSVAAFNNPENPLAPQLTGAPILIGAAVLLVELVLFWMLWRRGFRASLAMRLGFSTIRHIASPALTC